MLKKFLIILLSCFFVLNPAKSDAQEPFNSTIYTRYDVDEKGETTVNQRIQLINNSDLNYPEQYSLLVYTNDIKSIKARDNKGNILKDYLRKDGNTQIFLKFNDYVLGSGEEIKFRVSYKTKQLANKTDNGWEIIIPAAPEALNLNDYTVTLKVPDSFPQTAEFSTVPAFKQNHFYIWEKSQLLGKNVKVYFFNEKTSSNKDNILAETSERKQIKSKNRQLKIYLLGIGLGIGLFVVIILLFLINEKINEKIKKSN